MVHLVDSMVFYCNDYGSKLRTEQIMPKLQQKTQWQRCAYLDTQVVRPYTFIDKNVFGRLLHVEHGFWEQ